MKPEVSTVLAAVSGLISREVAPALGDTYLSEQLLRSAALLGAVGEEFDRAAARRVQENQALRRIFGQAAALVRPREPDLATALAGAADGSAAGAASSSHAAARTTMASMTRVLRIVGSVSKVCGGAPRC